MWPIAAHRHSTTPCISITDVSVVFGPGRKTLTISGRNCPLSSAGRLTGATPGWVVASTLSRNSDSAQVAPVHGSSLLPVGTERNEQGQQKHVDEGSSSERF